MEDDPPAIEVNQALSNFKVWGSELKSCYILLYKDTASALRKIVEEEGECSPGLPKYNSRMKKLNTDVPTDQSLNVYESIQNDQAVLTPRQYNSGRNLMKKETFNMPKLNIELISADT